MAKQILLMTAQWSDLSLEEICHEASEMGFDGLELSCSGSHLDLKEAATNPYYIEYLKDVLKHNKLNCACIAAHIAGKCVGEKDNTPVIALRSEEQRDKKQKVRSWGISQMLYAAHAANNLGVKIVSGFMGSQLWKYWYSFPPVSTETIENGFYDLKKLWDPIFDEFDRYGVQFAFELHPTEIAFDYWSAKKLLDVFHWRKTIGFTLDPSHLLWQGIDPNVFIKDFGERIYHVHLKDVAINLDGRNGILGSYLPFGNTRRGWNFVSLGHGDIDFDKIIRELNQIGYQGALSIEWEDNGMQRKRGVEEALAFAKQMNFEPSDEHFDAHLKAKKVNYV